MLGEVGFTAQAVDTVDPQFRPPFFLFHHNRDVGHYYLNTEQIALFARHALVAWDSFVHLRRCNPIKQEGPQIVRIGQQRHLHVADGCNWVSQHEPWQGHDVPHGAFFVATQSSNEWPCVVPLPNHRARRNQISGLRILTVVWFSSFLRFS